MAQETQEKRVIYENLSTNITLPRHHFFHFGRFCLQPPLLAGFVRVCSHSFIYHPSPSLESSVVPLHLVGRRSWSAVGIATILSHTETANLLTKNYKRQFKKRTIRWESFWPTFSFVPAKKKSPKTKNQNKITNVSKFPHVLLSNPHIGGFWWPYAGSTIQPSLSFFPPSFHAKHWTHLGESFRCGPT